MLSKLFGYGFGTLPPETHLRLLEEHTDPLEEKLVLE
jgi:hypothetical protein